MATSLTSIFGSEITVHAQPTVPQRQFAGFPGADGLVSMHLGTRGRQIYISGTLRESGVSYAAARQALQNKIDTVEVYCKPGVAAADYSYTGETYEDVVFGPLQLIPDGENKAFHYTAAKEMIVRFAIILTSLK